MCGMRINYRNLGRNEVNRSHTPGVVHTNLAVVDVSHQVMFSSYWNDMYLHPAKNLVELLF